MDEQRERIADAAIAWARAVQDHEDAYRAYLAKKKPSHEDLLRSGKTWNDMEYARQNLLQACGKVGA